MESEERVAAAPDGEQAQVAEQNGEEEPTDVQPTSGIVDEDDEDFDRTLLDGLSPGAGATASHWQIPAYYSNRALPRERLNPSPTEIHWRRQPAIAAELHPIEAMQHQMLPCRKTPHCTEGSQRRWPESGYTTNGPPEPLDNRRHANWFAYPEQRWRRHYIADFAEQRDPETPRLTLEDIKLVLIHRFGNLVTAFNYLDFFRDKAISLVEWQEGIYKVFMGTMGEQYRKYRCLCQPRWLFNKRLGQIFKDIDKDGNGAITYDELSAPRTQPNETARELTLRRTGELAAGALASSQGGAAGKRFSLAFGSTLSSAVKTRRGSLLVMPEVAEAQRQEHEMKGDIRSVGVYADMGQASAAESLAPTAKPEDSIAFSMTVLNVDYIKLVADSTLRAIFEETVKSAMAKVVGKPLTSDSVYLELLAGSVVLKATITPPTGIRTSDVLARITPTKKIGDEVAKRIGAMDGIKRVANFAKGAIRVIDISHPKVVPTVHRSLSGKKTVCLDDSGRAGTKKTKVVSGSDLLRVFAALVLTKFPSVEKAFAAIDHSGNGELSMGEFVAGVKLLRFSGDAKTVFNELDVDRGGSLSLKEFKKLQYLLQEKDTEELFQLSQKATIASKKETVAARRERDPIKSPDAHSRGKCLDSIHMYPHGERLTTSAGFYSFDRSTTGRMDNLVHPNEIPGFDPESFCGDHGPGYCERGPEFYPEVGCHGHPLRGNKWKSGATISRTERFGPMVPSAQARHDRELSSASFATYEGRTPADTMKVTNSGAHSLALRRARMGATLGTSDSFGLLAPKPIGRWGDTRMQQQLRSKSTPTLLKQVL